MVKNPLNDIALMIIREFDRLAGDRGNFEQQWQEISERILPAHSNTFTYSNNIGRTQGEKKTEKQFDSTAAIALGRFAAILDSMLTPQNQKWHKLRASNPELNKYREVKKYFEEVNDILFRYRYSPKANFASQNQQTFMSLGAYGTGAMFIDELQGEPGLRYKNIHLGEIYFSENHQGIIDKAFRHFKFTARQALQKWGDRCPQKIKKAIETNPEQPFYFIHAVMPREDYDPGRFDHKGMKFASYYVSREENKLLSEGGFDSFPYAPTRYIQSTGEVYGRGPAMDVLPAIKTLNEEKKTVLKQGQRALDPVLLAYDDGVLDGFSLRSGAINYGGVSADGRPLVHTLPMGNIIVGKELMDDEREVIKDSFLTSIFQILVDNPQRTATEVLEIAKEKGILLAPTVGRQRSEYLGPMAERELAVLNRQLRKGKPLLPPMPGILIEAEGEYTMEYDSPLDQVMRAGEVTGLMRTLDSTLQVVNITQDPSPLYNFNFDVIIPEIAEIQGVPMRWMNTPDVVAKLKQARDQQMQQQQMMQAAPGMAAVMKAGAVAEKG